MLGDTGEPPPAPDAEPGAGPDAGPGLAAGGINAVFRPVRAGNAFEETVERLLQVIKLGVVGHGERLPPERELAPRLGVSRVTLREAIRALQQEGYVESRRGRAGGTFVLYRPPRPRRGDLARVAAGRGEQLTDALTYRMAVETGAAQHLASTGLEPAQAARLRAALAAVNTANAADYRRLDTLFHLTIAELTGSELLSAACTDARMRVTDLLNAIPVLQRNIEHAAVQHAAIVDAVLAGDPEAARRAVAEHLEGTAALLRGFLA
ncbi:FadR/GntR family transcriptional regulator [Spirillospora sp. NPDC048911]|uniref:FadR/GntR family transcriptional regulator n=1 Tax=Spirillospora sp. NPDC048911 TaxID=3364527 RepID=UPI003719F838